LLPLKTARNTRTLGGYPAGAGRVTSSRLLRGDCFMPLSAPDRRHLLALGIDTVVDLREDGERGGVPSGLCGILRVRCYHIPLLPAGRGDSSAFPPDFTLGELYVEILDRSKTAVALVFRRIALKASAPDGRLLFHCSAGKDRTGVIAALLLALAEVDEELIVRDYSETDANLLPVLDRLRASSSASAETFLHAGRENMEQMLRHLRGTYGGAAAYLSAAGLSAGEMRAVTDMMVATERKTAIL
jgi:protein-tyrosine phosphatase